MFFNSLRRGAAGILAATVASAAHAQTAASAIDRALLERQQQQDEFTLKMQQSQALSNPALTPAERQALGTSQQAERRSLERRHNEQLRRHGALEQTLPALPQAQQQLQLDIERAEFSRERMVH